MRIDIGEEDIDQEEEEMPPSWTQHANTAEDEVLQSDWLIL